MPRYFFDVEDGHRLSDRTGFVCDDDIAAIIRATVLAVREPRQIRAKVVTRKQELTAAPQRD